MSNSLCQSEDSVNSLYPQYLIDLDNKIQQEINELRILTSRGDMLQNTQKTEKKNPKNLIDYKKLDSMTDGDDINIILNENFTESPIKKSPSSLQKIPYNNQNQKNIDDAKWSPFKGNQQQNFDKYHSLQTKPPIRQKLDQKPQKQNDNSCTFKPKILKKSSEISNTLQQKPFERLTTSHIQKNKKQEIMRQQIQNELIFQPKIIRTPSYINKQSNQLSQYLYQDRSESPPTVFNKLYNDCVVRRETESRKILEKNESVGIDAELTFKPNLSKTSKQRFDKTQLERSEHWNNQKKLKMVHKREITEEINKRDCTFTPKILKKSQNSLSTPTLLSLKNTRGQEQYYYRMDKAHIKNLESKRYNSQSRGGCCNTITMPSSFNITKQDKNENIQRYSVSPLNNKNKMILFYQNKKPKLGGEDDRYIHIQQNKKEKKNFSSQIKQLHEQLKLINI